MKIFILASLVSLSQCKQRSANELNFDPRHREDTLDYWLLKEPLQTASKKASSTVLVQSIQSASIKNDTVAIHSNDHVELWEKESKVASSEVGKCADHPIQSLQDVSLSSDGQWVLAGSEQGFHIFQRDASQLQCRFYSRPGFGRILGFSPQQSWFAFTQRSQDREDIYVAPVSLPGAAQNISLNSLNKHLDVVQMINDATWITDDYLAIAGSSEKGPLVNVYASTEKPKVHFSKSGFQSSPDQALYFDRPQTVILSKASEHIGVFPTGAIITSDNSVASFLRRRVLHTQRSQFGGRDGGARFSYRRLGLQLDSSGIDEERCFSESHLLRVGPDLGDRYVDFSKMAPGLVGIRDARFFASVARFQPDCQLSDALGYSSETVAIKVFVQHDTAQMARITPIAQLLLDDPEIRGVEHILDLQLQGSHVTWIDARGRHFSWNFGDPIANAIASYQKSSIALRSNPNPLEQTRSEMLGFLERFDEVELTFESLKSETLEPYWFRPTPGLKSYVAPLIATYTMAANGQPEHIQLIIHDNDPKIAIKEGSPVLTSGTIEEAKKRLSFNRKQLEPLTKAFLFDQKDFGVGLFLFDLRPDLIKPLDYLDNTVLFHPTMGISSLPQARLCWARIMSKKDPQIPAKIQCQFRTPNLESGVLIYDVSQVRSQRREEPSMND